MKTVRTIKVKISGTKETDKLLPKWLSACNWLSKKVFKSKELNSNRLAKEFYGTVRKKFKLPSQLTCSLFKTISATYKTAKSNKRWKLAKFKNPSMPVVWRRDFARTKKGITLWGKPITLQDPRQLPEHWKDSKLFKKGDQWFLNLCHEIDIPEAKTTGSIIGVDQGIKRTFVATSSTGKNTFFKNGRMKHRLACIRRTRSALQSVGTKAAKRLKKRLSGNEASVTAHAIHVVSKKLVVWAESNDARKIILEDLSNIRKSSLAKGKTLRTAIHRWPYAKFAFCVSYKAAAKGILTELVSPRNTSRMCSKCGYVDEKNRKGLSFVCTACGYRCDADLNGARNIATRSLFVGLNLTKSGSSKSPEICDISCHG